MPDESPTIPKHHATRFTRENAREMAARSAARRRAVPFHFPPVAQPEPAPASDPRLQLLEEQITITRATLTTERMEPHHRAALLRSLCALLDQQRIARGEPLPGSRRPGPDKGKINGRVWHEPVPVVPQAGPVAPAELGGPEWSI